MSDVTFGLSPERMKQLLECKAEVGHVPQVSGRRPAVKVHVPKPKVKPPAPVPVMDKKGRVLLMTPTAIRNRKAQAIWRAKNRELQRARVRESMRRFRERKKLEASR